MKTISNYFLLLIPVCVAIWVSFIFRQRKGLKQLAQTNKSLKDLTNEELNKYLDKNETMAADVLACICSEILRRKKDL